MTMHLYKLFSCNMEIQYKSYLLSKATLFTLITIALNILLPLIIVSKGFWFKSFYFYEQPMVQFAYEYLLVAETEDSSRPVVCGNVYLSEKETISGWETCADIRVRDNDVNNDGINESIDIKIQLLLPPDNAITSVLLIAGLDFRLQTVCPLHMQSLAVVTHDFPIPPTALEYIGALQLSQATHLSSSWFSVDTTHNTSAFHEPSKDRIPFGADLILNTYFRRNVTTYTKPIFARSKAGHTEKVDLAFTVHVPELQILYSPSLMEVLTSAWPQYLSLFIVIYLLLNKIKRFVFVNRLLMAWEVVPGKNDIKEFTS